jgi:hypothetical protein
LIFVLKSVTSASRAVEGWKLRLDNYQFKAEHLPGKENFIADFLSLNVAVDLVRALDVTTRRRSPRLVEKERKAQLAASEAAAGISMTRSKKKRR